MIYFRINETDTEKNYTILSAYINMRTVHLYIVNLSIQSTIYFNRNLHCSSLFEYQQVEETIRCPVKQSPRFFDGYK